MLKQSVDKLVDGTNLTIEESKNAYFEMLREDNSYLSAAFLALIKAKGETVEEILGIVQGLRQTMIKVTVANPVMDIVGTGGDGAHTLNISTGAAILAASGGVKIAKHGNRAVSSLCGSADVLEELGVNISMSAEDVTKCIEKIGIGFMYAPQFHPALTSIAPVRRALKMRTIFNLLGPLVNPAQASLLMIGVSSENLLDIMAEVIFKLGTFRALIFYGNGIDELSCLGKALIREVDSSGIKTGVLDPQALGLPICTLEDLKGGNAKENAARMLKAFEGHKDAYFYTLALNSGVAHWLSGNEHSIEAGIEKSIQDLVEDKAMQKLKQWKDQ